jgi:hypothetical protein
MVDPKQKPIGEPLCCTVYTHAMDIETWDGAADSDDRRLKIASLRRTDGGHIRANRPSNVLFLMYGYTYMSQTDIHIFLYTSISVRFDHGSCTVQ